MGWLNPTHCAIWLVSAPAGMACWLRAGSRIRSPAVTSLLLVWWGRLATLRTGREDSGTCKEAGTGKSRKLDRLPSSIETSEGKQERFIMFGVQLCARSGFSSQPARASSHLEEADGQSIKQPGRGCSFQHLQGSH